MYCLRATSSRLVSARLATTGTARRVLSNDAKNSAVEAPKVGLWSDAKFWGGLGALAGWGMSGAAIYDATLQGPEVISLPMTGVLLIYSSLFARWAFIVKPQNLLLAGCHIANIGAQSNQMRRGLEHKMKSGQEEEVKKMLSQAACVGVVGGAAILSGPFIRKGLMEAKLGAISSVAAAEAGPFTLHFWAPMSKWMISGASFFEFDRPTDKISLPQYTALTLTGLFFTRYALLVNPVNYTLCSVNVALFLSSVWHLSRKIKADYVDPKP